MINYFMKSILVMVLVICCGMVASVTATELVGVVESYSISTDGRSSQLLDGGSEVVSKIVVFNNLSYINMRRKAYYDMLEQAMVLTE